MDIYDAIKTLRNNLPNKEADAEIFLDSLTPDLQEQLIAAIYLGREHVNCAELRQDVAMDRSIIKNVKKTSYPMILWEKDHAIPTYLDKLVECAKASGFDLKSL